MVSRRGGHRRAAHPEFDDATAIFAYDFGDGEIGVYAPADPRGRILADLGFDVPPQIASLFGDEFYTVISLEQLELLDADVVVWVTYTTPETAAVRDNDLYRNLPIVREGSDIFIADNDELNGAISFSSPSASRQPSSSSSRASLPPWTATSPPRRTNDQVASRGSVLVPVRH